MKLLGKAVIVTGATSGIGRATAILFAREGAKVVVNGRSIERGQQVVDEIRADGGDAFFVRADVSRASEVRALIDIAAERYGRIDVLVNNAAYMQPGKPITELTEKAWDDAIDTTLKSAFLCSKYAIPKMVKVGGGSIVNVSSIGGIIALDRNPAYCAAKGGLQQLTKVTAVDYADQNIRVNAICVGQVDTPGARPAKEDRANYERTIELNPQHRWAEPQEIAKVILFLASEDASFMTASLVVVDAGYTAR